MPPPSALRRRLRQRRVLFGAWTSLAHPSIAEVFARTGVDFVGIDLEHSTISFEQAQEIIAAAQAAGAACLPRASGHHETQIRRLMDCGAEGIIVPNVTTADQVDRLLNWCKYPPRGKRSYGVARAQGYGLDFDAYTAQWNARSVFLIQIESVEGVEAADELVRHPDVDGVMIGPYDISGSLGIAGQLDHPRVAAACQRVVDVCRRRGKACGTPLVEPDLARVSAALAAGYTFVVLASDVFILWKWSERMQRLMAAQRRPTTRHVSVSAGRHR